MRAQNALSGLMDVYLYAGRKLLPQVLPCLRNEQTVSHEQFKVQRHRMCSGNTLQPHLTILFSLPPKGALHLLLMGPMMNVYIHDWAMLKETLPVIVQVHWLTYNMHVRRYMCVCCRPTTLRSRPSNV